MLQQQQQQQQQQSQQHQTQTQILQQQNKKVYSRINGDAASAETDDELDEMADGVPTNGISAQRRQLTASNDIGMKCSQI